eukprot:TRINITY_DN1511_c0_g1_i1.p1 TRINITY_DN1511_c0_g1~~TRINITY_DN1511_c0_g1_i1.p1  ORF type:complete len:404 (-),score=94.27 TRINITY_DN1511_c0_g1_i1:31-1242(-)
MSNPDEPKMAMPVPETGYEAIDIEEDDDVVAEPIVIAEPIAISQPVAIAVQPQLISAEMSSSAQVVAPTKDSMLPEVSKTCRLCGKGQRNDEIESGISTLIYPCKCPAPIHRKCLDKWRVVKNGDAFVKCDGCNCTYRLEVKEGVDITKRKIKFGLLFARDTIAFLLVIQLLIIACAFAIERIDSCTGKGGCGTNCKPNCGESGAPGGKLLNIFFIGHFEMGYKATYYLMGLALFLAVIGVIGLCVWTSRKCTGKSSCDCSSDIDDCCMIWYISSASNMDSGLNHSHGSSCSGCHCGNCNCNGCGSVCGDCGNCGKCSGCSCGDCGGCDGEGAAIVGAIALVVAIVVLVLFIVLGVVFGFIGVTVVATKIFQRHYHILKRSELSKIYIVKVCINITTVCTELT